MHRIPREFAGMESFVWFYGVVEDRADPLHLGRVRVRIHAWHSDSKTDLPTSSLPWAQVMTPITNASMSGVGVSPLGPVEGTTVFGFFLDGRNAQQPFILGTSPGINTQASGQSDRGFTDPNGKYPLELGYPDTPKLAYDRYEEDESYITKKDSRIEDVETANDNTWSEPEQRGGESQYPYNHVSRSESGHVFERDDTPDAERIHEYHKAGTFREIQADGTTITKIVGSSYEITMQDKNVLVKGTCNITIEGDSTLYIKGNLIEKVDGDYELNVTGDHRITAKKTYVNNDVDIEGTSTASVDHISNGISGHDHTHTDSEGLGAGETTPPNE